MKVCQVIVGAMAVVVLICPPCVGAVIEAGCCETADGQPDIRFRLRIGSDACMPVPGETWSAVRRGLDLMYEAARRTQRLLGDCIDGDAGQEPPVKGSNDADSRRSP